MGVYELFAFLGHLLRQVSKVSGVSQSARAPEGLGRGCRSSGIGVCCRHAVLATQRIPVVSASRRKRIYLHVRGCEVLAARNKLGVPFWGSNNYLGLQCLGV